MNAWKVFIVAAVIFGSGLVTGAILARRASQAVLPPALTASETNRPPHGVRPDQARRFDFLRRAQRELGLTPEQQAQVERIVQEGQERMRATWEEFSPRMQAHLKETREQIAEVLTPEQQQRFDELMKQRRPSKPQDGPGHEGRREGPWREPPDPLHRADPP